MSENMNNKLKSVRPIIVLSSADKIFLAASRRDDEIFSYVLALVCNRNPAGKDFILTPVKEVYAFESRDAANAFYGAAQQMADMNQQLMPDVFRMLGTLVKDFNEKIR